MRSLVTVLAMLMFFVSMADARPPVRVRSVETVLLFYAGVGILPSEHSPPEARGVTLRWGRTYWPLSEFGNCFAELRTPAGVSRTRGYWGKAVVSWEGEVYTAHCFNGPTVYWSKIKK